MITKEHLLKFLKFLDEPIKTKPTTDDTKILKYYKKNMLNIDNKSLNNLLQETTKEELINKLSLLFKNKKISYPWINFKISKEEVLEILKKIKKGESIEESKYYNNLNYFLIYYFSENEILDCKKKEKFITPNEIIYSNNNFLENMFNQLIYSNNSILFDDIKLYIKKNIGCCSINNIFYIINIIKIYVILGLIGGSGI
jgi:hypothetical protein